MIAEPDEKRAIEVAHIQFHIEIGFGRHCFPASSSSSWFAYSYCLNVHQNNFSNGKRYMNLNQFEEVSACADYMCDSS